MMQHRAMKGQKLGYRPVAEAELRDDERRRAYEGQDRARKALGARARLVAMAREDRPGFDRLAKWVVATCRSGTEQAVHDELREQGIDVWCPLEKFRVSPRRGLKAVDIYRPYFKGYLFIKVIPDNEAFVGLLSASRLKGLMGRDGSPFLVPDRLVDALILGARKTERDQDDERILPVREGQRVVIRSGPFSEFQATVRRVLGERRKLLAEADMFGRMTPMELDIDSVTACS